MITLDDLARMVADGFSAQEEHLERMIEAKLEAKLEAKFSEKLDPIWKEIRKIHARLDDVVVPQLDDHSRRIKDLELART